MARAWTEGKGIGMVAAMKNRRANQRDTLIFMAIAILLMLVADHFLFGGKRSYHEKIKEDYYREHPEARPQPVAPAATPDAVPDVSPAPDAVEEEHSALDLYEDLPHPEPDNRDLPPPEPILPIHDETFSIEKAALAPAVTPAAPAPEIKIVSVPTMVPPSSTGKKDRIVIIIDDVGMNVKNSRAVIDLPAPVTLAFLPYAPQVRTMAQDAIAAGHETMIHVPMEAIGSNAGLGPLALRSTMNEGELNAQLEKMFASFDGYKGINNHMGSKLTQDQAAMDTVMAALRARDLYFIDSKTIGSSIAQKRAAFFGVPHAGRDVFLDHEESATFVAAALARAERLAHLNGYAVVIGHPKDVTVAGLKTWLPTLKDKNLEIVPASAVLTRPAAIATVKADKAPTKAAPAPAVIQPAAAALPAPAPQPAPLP